MIPIHEIDIYTRSDVFYKIYLIYPKDTGTYSAEIILHDAESGIPFSSTINLHHQFPDAETAFRQALSWVIAYAGNNSYIINRIDNPTTTEFLDRASQQAVVDAAGLSVTVQINGQ